MKTKEELQEDAGLVRDIIAVAGVDFPANDFERDLRDGLFRKGYSMTTALEVGHVRRLNEALCAMKFPSVAALGLRQALLTRLAQHHELKKYRGVKMPVFPPPQSASDRP